MVSIVPRCDRKETVASLVNRMNQKSLDGFIYEVLARNMH